MKIYWTSANQLKSKDFKCGHCGASVASEKGFTGHSQPSAGQSQYSCHIYICHKCNGPTFFDYENKQTPGPLIGAKVRFIPSVEVEELFNEAKSCFSISAFTSSVMCCRKLLMNISVAEGAPEGKNFNDYVDYLDTNNYIPPNGKKWVHSIRKSGNDANHKITFKNEEDATRILNFTEMLLRFIYELPGIMGESELK